MIDLIIGLGNPGDKYQTTRHNIGFMILDELAQNFHLDFKSSKFNALIASTSINDKKVFFMKPLTFMNKSGESLAQFLKFYQSEEVNPFIVYDDLDLPFGKLKLARSGSSGGHNGIKSIINHLGNKDFHRLRVGIDKPISKDQVSNYVLNPFNSEEKKEIPFILSKSVDIIDFYIKNDLDLAMNEFH
jgi:PTH1 family peptidyl-tRNA hydrolase